MLIIADSRFDDSEEALMLAVLLAVVPAAQRDAV
jgi:hypothetical protein